MDKKICKKCNIEKYLLDFNIEKKKISKFCKDCCAKQIEENNNSINKYWKEKKKLKSRVINKTDKKHIKLKYGITEEDYIEMFNKQYSRCAICKRPQIEFKKRLSIDHNHKTGEIRGLLCAACNLALGLLRENKIAVSNMLKYIDFYKGGKLLLDEKKYYL